jgi:two-component system, NarL family, sensor histidine kinase BarA
MIPGFLRRLLGGWRLESKSLLFLGLALLTSILLNFIAVQAVATRLVVERTRQTARDVAKSFIFGEHVEAYNPSGTDTKRADVLRELRKDMLSTDFSFELYRLDDDYEFDFLGGSVPTSNIDRSLMEKIDEAMLKAADEAEAAESSELQPSVKKDEIAASLFTGPKPIDLFFQEYGPVGDFYYYYHPVTFTQSCLDCHAPQTTVAQTDYAASLPFRVLRVKMPYTETRHWKIWSYSIMIAIGLATLALTLFFIHWILHRLVIRPVRSLRDSFDEVSKGDLQTRSEIDTDDEFRELSDAFNRMLLHLNESQMQVQEANQELDKRVDQLAQLNLRLYEANRLKSDFLANMSHELRTPLNSILGFSEVLQGFDTLTEKQKRYAANIQKSGRLLLEMINDILDLAKVEAGKMEVRVSKFDLIALVHGQCEVVRSIADDKNIDLQIVHGLRDEREIGPEDDSDDTLDGQHLCPLNQTLMVEQDQPKLQQVLTNLLSNAIKFTPQGGIISLTVSEFEQDFFKLVVTDTGVGIAEEDHEAIFEKFRQVHSKSDGEALTREYSGTGLGLSIVRELCRLLGGEISLQSQLGKGSAFTVVLPKRYEKPVEATTSAFVQGTTNNPLTANNYS